MKKVLALVAAVGLIAAATTAMGATIQASKHDLSAGSVTGGLYGGTSTQICVYCHAPHNAALSLPLWNRVNPAGSLFRLYSGVNMANQSFASGFTSDSTSLFCMSCHDGVTTIGAVYNAGVIDGTGGTSPHPAKVGAFGTIPLPGTAGTNLSRNLSKTHPINFPVSTLDPQTDLWPNTGTVMGKASFTMPLFKVTGANRATTRSLECGSCHAVHDSQFSPFLRYTMNKSALCLGCHNK